MKKRLDEAPLYIGGWLVLVGLRLFFSLYINFTPVRFDFSGIDLRTAGILLAVFILYALAVFTLFIKRHRAFPAAYIGLEAYSAVSNISLLLISLKLGAASPDILPLVYTAVPALLSVLLIIYTLRSERVRKTFVFGWNETPDPRLVDKANGRRGDYQSPA